MCLPAKKICKYCKSSYFRRSNTTNKRWTERDCCFEMECIKKYRAKIFESYQIKESGRSGEDCYHSVLKGCDLEKKRIKSSEEHYINGFWCKTHQFFICRCGWEFKHHHEKNHAIKN